MKTKRLAGAGEKRVIVKGKIRHAGADEKALWQRAGDIKQARLFPVGDEQRGLAFAAHGRALVPAHPVFESEKGDTGLLRKGEKKGFFSAAARAKETHMV